MNNNFIIDIMNEYWENMMMNFFNTQNNNWSYNEVLEYIGEYIKPKERRKIVELFQDCKCCIRHKFRRPTLAQYDNMFSGHYNDFIDDEDDETDYECSSDEDEIDICMCVCRHANRSLCEVNNLMCSIINDSK
jgi:hypothetical protein